MTSEAKIYIILSKEWKINRYGPWIFHKDIFSASQFGQDESAPTPCGKGQWARSWAFCIVQWGCVPRGEDPRTSVHCQDATMCLCRLLCQPCLGQSCSHPLREGTVRLTWERGDEGNL